jgi:hypothetical protein
MKQVCRVHGVRNIVISANTLQATHGNANAGGRRNEAGACHWFLKQAMNTGDVYWWYR